jgi:transcriptional repressor NrdR
VIDSREAEDGTSIRRRRACDRCEERFTTFERSESARIQVLKRDGSRQEFDRRKLSSAIEKAASTSLSPEKLSALIDDLAVLDRRREVSRDRKVAEQTVLIEDVPVAAGARRRKR